MRASETLLEAAPATGVGPTLATSVGIRLGPSCRWPPRDQAWLAITALLAVTDYTEHFRGGWFLLARRGHAGRPVAPCLGGQNDGWYGSAEAWAAARAAGPCI